MGLGKLVLVLGGARSGKSRFAEELAAAIGKEDVVYLATAEAGDEEMKERIRLHQEMRPSCWRTVEETVKVARAIKAQGRSKVILVDCLTLLVSNLLFQGGEFKEDAGAMVAKEKEVLVEIEEAAKAAKEVEATVIMVANEVGLGLVPPYPMGRAYRDAAGRANQLVARYADEVYFTIAGIPLELKDLNRQLVDRLGREKR
ncbi:MAG: bifunctional adenosylcobinamide kinase/adenosylcobinamide-phosphate guanylyltransferase [Clostridia bacterium]|nr:bifunctional adenosylcobinamide kinase/adenosylcobinamide-phosphate guanylyltransferase [Clostridia bacterium]